MNSKRCYEVQIKSLCPPEGYLLVEGRDRQEAADLLRRFLTNGSPDDFEKGLRVLQMPFEDAIGCGQYEIGSIRPVEVRPEGRFPILKREDIEALDCLVEEIQRPVVIQNDGDLT